MNRDFLRGVLRGDKTLLPLNKVIKVEVPKYDELAVKQLQGHLKNDPAFMRFFPDSLPKGRFYDREYFFQILYHVHREYTKEIIAHATAQRMSANPEQQEDKTIKVNQDWSKKLMEHPFLSQVSQLSNLTLNLLETRTVDILAEVGGQAGSEEDQ